MAGSVLGQPERERIRKDTLGASVGTTKNKHFKASWPKTSKPKQGFRKTAHGFREAVYEFVCFLSIDRLSESTDRFSESAPEITGLPTCSWAPELACWPRESWAA